MLEWLTRCAKLDFAPCAPSRSRASPYDKIKENSQENASTFLGVFFYFIARLIANANITR